MYSEGAQNYEIDPKIHLRSEDKSKTFLGSTTLSGIYNLNAGEKATIRENLNKQAYISHNLPFKKVDFPKTLKPRVNGEEHTAHPQTKHVEQTRITQAISMQLGKDFEPIDTEFLRNFMLRPDHKENWKTLKGFRKHSKLEESPK